jgi:hypothetical protein
MVTECGGGVFWNASDFEAVFVQGTYSMLKFVLPAAVLLTAWKICDKRTTNQSTSILGLSGPDQYADHEPRQVRALYILTSGLTFFLGVFSYHAFLFLHHAATSLLPSRVRRNQKVVHQVRSLGNALRWMRNRGVRVNFLSTI